MAKKRLVIAKLQNSEHVVSTNNLLKYFSLDLINVMEFPEDFNLQVEVNITIHMNPRTSRPADLIDQFKEQNQ